MKIFISCVLLAILSTTDGSGGGSERTTCFGLPFGYDIMAKVGIGNIKRIRSPQDMLGELSNFLVKMKKIVPSNLYEATFDHTLVLGIALDQMYSMLPLSRAMGELAWTTNTEFLLVAIPLFILLGELLLRAGFAERMYSALSLWLSWLPGGLMHANIGASALFAAAVAHQREPP